MKKLNIPIPHFWSFGNADAVCFITKIILFFVYILNHTLPLLLSKDKRHLEF